jgi:CBS domain-containing protein
MGRVRLGCTRAAGWDTCVVVDERGVILGRLRREALDGDLAGRVEDVMESGPATYRPNVPVEEATAQMAQVDVESVLVSSPDGKLIGLFVREVGGGG